MRGDALLFIGIIVFIFVVWVAMGGPSRPISFSGPFVTPLAPSATTSSGYRLSDAGRSNTQTATSLAKAQQGLVTLQKSLVEANQFGTPSPYRGQVTIRHSVGSLLTNDPDKEYLTISVSYRIPDAGINISGWRVESAAEARSFAIPEGVNVPRSGAVNPGAPIVLGPGQSATITTGESPIGISFRENMCTGYFEQFQNFSPPISRLCPLPSSDFERFYLGNTQNLDACKAYVRTVDRCEIPLDEPSTIGTDCYQFINTYLNYNGCVDAHKADHGFYGSSWRIYAGLDDEFFTHDHDSVKLLDASGRTVDLLSY